MTFWKNTAAFMLALFASSASLALADDAVPQVTVNYGDLNISHRAGARVLVTRLKHGAESVCGEKPYISDLRSYAAHQACVKASMERAVAAVGEPMVTEAYEHSTPRAFVASN